MEETSTLTSSFILFVNQFEIKRLPLNIARAKIKLNMEHGAVSQVEEDARHGAIKNIGPV